MENRLEYLLDLKEYLEGTGRSLTKTQQKELIDLLMEQSSAKKIKDHEKQQTK